MCIRDRTVDEPTVEDTISILRGLKDRYEVYHGVKMLDNALVSAAVLSDRYISDRFLPDKAIDLVDEACALIKTELDSMPTELDELSRKIMQMEIEEAALKKETDHLSQDRLADLQKENAMVAFVDDSLTESKAKALQSELEKVNNVADCTFVSRQEARDEYVAKYDEDDMYKDLQPEVFRHRYVIHLTCLLYPSRCV